VVVEFEVVAVVLDVAADVVVTRGRVSPALLEIGAPPPVSVAVVPVAGFALSVAIRLFAG
jgi:hypothetical protein